MRFVRANQSLAGEQVLDGNDAGSVAFRDGLSAQQSESEGRMGYAAPWPSGTNFGRDCHVLHDRIGVATGSCPEPVIPLS